MFRRREESKKLINSVVGEEFVRNVLEVKNVPKRVMSHTKCFG